MLIWHHEPSPPIFSATSGAACVHRACARMRYAVYAALLPLVFEFAVSFCICLYSCYFSVAIPLSTSSALRRPSVSGSVSPFALTHRERSCQQPPVYATPRHAMSSCTQICSSLSSFVLVLVTCSEVSHSFSLFSLTHS
jgi:hypothetical protein